MPRLSRTLPILAVATAFVTFPLSSFSQDVSPPPAPAPAVAQQPAPELRQAVDDFWHYAKVARPDLANQAAQQVLTQFKDKPADVLQAFTTVAADHHDDLDQWLLRWQLSPDLKDSVNQLINLLNQGRATHRSDVLFIQQNIERLSTNERGYALGLQQLRQSGELSVPLMIDYLRDPSKKPYQASVRRALADLGKTALNPLVAATEMKDTDTLVVIIDALGSIGYDASVPYLARIANDNAQPAAIQSAAMQALVRMGVQNPKSINPAEAFYDLGEKLYYDQSAITAPAGQDKASVWYYDQNTGLVKKDVPAPIFNEVMAMRACEYSLKLDPNSGKAVSLWLASNFKRESELPAGATDLTRGENQPDAHYYAVASGTQFLNPVLARASRDRNSAVAFKAIKALEVTAGAANLNSSATGNSSNPVIDALSFPDRAIRFEAAYAVGSSMPQSDFQGKDRAVQILADALNQTGKPNVLVVLPSQNDINTMAESLGQEYAVMGGTTVNGALEQAAKLPSVDYIIVSEDMPQDQIDRLFDAANTNDRLDGASRIVITHTGASRFAAMANNNPMLSLTQVGTPEGIRLAIQAARQKTGGMAMDPTTTSANALRSAELLSRLAISRGQVLDLSLAQPALLTALSSPTPDLVKASGMVLSQLNSKDAQAGLAMHAMDDKTPDELKISLLNDLATNAKFYGNQLSPESVAGIEKAVHDTANLQVRSAAAEARGALNLPADQAKKLIVEQSKI